MSQPSSSTELNYAIAGMDCADCARKIEGVVNKTPGASNPKVNFTAEKLSLHLDESITPRAELERRIAAIGYKPTLAAGHGPAIERDHAGHDHAGHDHSSHDDHSGHDHNKHEGETAAALGFDPHAGHDHATDAKEATQAIQARQVPLWDQEARQVLPSGQESSEKLQREEETAHAQKAVGDRLENQTGDPGPSGAGVGSRSHLRGDRQRAQARSGFAEGFTDTIVRNIFSSCVHDVNDVFSSWRQLTQGQGFR